MKKILTIGAAITFMAAAPSFAADMALKAAPPVAAPVSSWTGFYIGGDVGGAWSDPTGTFTPLPSPAVFGVNTISGADRGSAFIGGLHVGYNWQFAPVWVAGLEGDWSWTHAGGSFSQPWTFFGTTTPVVGSFTNMSSRLDWISSVRGRLGYLVTPTVMAYATGGAAWARTDYAATSNNGITYSASTATSATQPGFVVGGGIEWAATQHWLLRAEYLYYQFDRAPNVVAQAPGFPTFPSQFSWGDTRLNVVRAGVSYKF